MSEPKEYPDAVWDYAHRIANTHDIVTIPAAGRGLLPDIIELLEGEGNSFKCLTANKSIGAMLSGFASSDLEFTAPNNKKWRPNMRQAADCADTAEGLVEALRIMTRALPYTLVLVTNADNCPQQFRDLFAEVCMDARLVILE